MENPNHGEARVRHLVARFFEPTGANSEQDCPDELVQNLTRRLAQGLEEQFAERERIRIPEGLARAHRIATRRNRRRLRRWINNLLGTLADRYRAQHAWVCVPAGPHVWRARFSFRRQLRNQVVKLNERCIISHVIETCKVHVAPHTESDPYYKAENPATQSQLTGPILVHGAGPDQRLLAVVSFESESSGNFTEEQARQLTSDAQELAVPLLCLEAMDGDDFSKWPFNPERHGWSGDRILKEVCYEFNRSVSSEFREADLSTTVWHADWDCRELWARATCGYSFEYLRQVLPFDSFTGESIQAEPPGAVLRVTLDHPSFHERERAESMGLKRLLSCPVMNPGGGFRPMGAVNVYQFQRDTPDRLPADEVVREFARMVAHVTLNVEKLRNSVVSEHLSWQMERSARLADPDQLVAAQFHVLKEALHEYFGANGCSIYVPDEREEELTIVASTGTRGERFRYHEGRWVLGARDPSSYKLTEQGVMQYLYYHPGKALILNDVQRLPQVREMIDPELPDTIVASGMDHVTPDTTARRFMGIGLRILGRNWMVIRLTRSTEHAPFTKFDARLLENLGLLCRQNEMWIPAAQHASTDSVGKQVARYTGAPAGRHPLSVAKPQTSNELLTGAGADPAGADDRDLGTDNS